MKTSLTIAGYDPTGLAGITSDLSTFEKLGLKGISLQTALTAQDGKSVKKVVPLPASLLKKQASLLLNTFKPDSVKIGMTGDKEVTNAIISIIKSHKLKNIVCDTVLKSGGGYPLIKKNAIDSLKNLLSISTLITPNIDEAQILTGIKIKNIRDMELASNNLFELGCKNVLITGGHLKGNPTDVLFNGKKHIHFKGHRISGNKVRLHGTGCLLSAAIAGYLAKGKSIEKSVKYGKEFLEKSIKERQYK